MAGNSDLLKANKDKKDEFYTQLADIEIELKHYRKHFKDKVVFLSWIEKVDCNLLSWLSNCW